MTDENENKAESAASAVESIINQYGGHTDAETMVSHFCGMHRTLQQAFTSRIIIPFIRRLAMNYTDGWYDPRNETACKACRAMYDALKAEYGREGDDDEIALPMI